MAASRHPGRRPPDPSLTLDAPSRSPPRTDGERADEDGLRPLLGRVFRANPAFRLVAHADLTEDERAPLAALAATPDHFGVLLPAPGSGLGVQALDRAAARLLDGLAEPGPLPEPLREGSRPDDNRRVALLVLDGVLEIEAAGGFVSGPRAHGEVLETPLRAPRPATGVARLSDEALRRAQALPVDDPARLASWLYGFGTLPLSPAWLRRLPGWPEVERLAGLDAAAAAGRRLREHFHPTPTAGWMNWRHARASLRHADADGSRPAYKLYVSPPPAALADVAGPLVDLLVEREVAAMKLGRDARGVLRPDKVVVYFDEPAALHAFAADLEARISGCPAHGVPFTAALDDDGVLSWGVDPPRSARIPGWRGSESWRVWITERLARALHRTRAVAGGTPEPRLAALDRIRVEGVDPDSWLPRGWLWREGPGAGPPSAEDHGSPPPSRGGKALA